MQAPPRPPLVLLLVGLLALVASCGGTAATSHTSRSHPPQATHLSHRPTPSPQASPPAPKVILQPGLPTVHVPILMYHYIEQVPPNDPDPTLRAELTVTPRNFQQQMAWLAANGYHTITMAQLRGYFQGTNDLPANPVALTFDDGHQDFYTNALPILQTYHFTATAFVISGFIDDASGASMRRWQVLAISQAGIEIGAHTFNHLDLTTLSATQVQQELGPPKTTLESWIGQPVLDFAYPAGRYDPSVVTAVQAAGYQSAVTTRPGTTHDWAGRFTWERQEVVGTESLAAFIQQLGPTDPVEEVASRG